MSTGTAHQEIKGRKDKHRWGRSQLPSASRRNLREQNSGSLRNSSTAAHTRTKQLERLDNEQFSWKNRIRKQEQNRKTMSSYHAFPIS
ncbi:hypothetical protein D623_10035973 [Myotis brandtii]|uniref:Uncharacterized protein n=1 Tax=Myotis brandtii TaxID=109478 RepID=S7MFL8_MYOBR|nr:hypothetical protein D623_10035973 [Myotis brandtii]